MPSGNSSGSHGSSGGSHFSSSSSSSSSGSSSSGGYGDFNWRYHSRGPRVVILNGRRYYSYLSGKGSLIMGLLTFLLITLIMALIVSGLRLSVNNNNVNYIKDDYAYYQQMIREAESDPRFVKDATILKHEYNPTAKKWYFTYRIESGVGLEGYTFAVYSEDEILDARYRVGSTIQVATNEEDVDYGTDSIPMDYKDMPITRDGEYTHYLGIRNMWIGLLVLFVAGAGGSVAGMIITNKKTRQYSEVPENKSSFEGILHSNEDIFKNVKSWSTSVKHTSIINENGTTTITTTNPDGTITITTTNPDGTTTTTTSNNQEKELPKKSAYKNEITYCPYCGERITKGAKKCPKCKADL